MNGMNLTESEIAERRLQIAQFRTDNPDAFSNGSLPDALNRMSHIGMNLSQILEIIGKNESILKFMFGSDLGNRKK
jgi:hypothetical protein